MSDNNKDFEHEMALSQNGYRRRTSEQGEVVKPIQDVQSWRVVAVVGGHQSMRREGSVGIAGEVGGRWSSETKNFLWCVVCEKALSASSVLRGEQPGGRDGVVFSHVPPQKAFASSLVNKRGSPGAGSQVPSVHQVLGDSWREV